MCTFYIGDLFFPNKSQSQIAVVRPVSLRKGLSIVRSDGGESLNQQSAVAKASNEREYPSSLSTCLAPLYPTTYKSSRCITSKMLRCQYSVMQIYYRLMFGELWSFILVCKRCHKQVFFIHTLVEHVMLCVGGNLLAI